MDKEKHIPQKLAPLFSVAATAGFIYDIASKAVSFLEILNEHGIDAFRTFIRPGILALIALIISIAYVSSQKKSGAETADGGSTGKAHAFFDSLTRIIVKTCIGIVIAGIVIGCVYAGFMYKEYTQRPHIDVFDYVDLAPAIDGYEGEATFDPDKVEVNLPDDIKTLYEDSNTKNYDNTEDYSERNDEWYRFRSHFKYEYSGSTSNLTKDDVIEVTAVYKGNDLSAVKAGTHVIITGVGTTKSYKIGDIKDLPHEFKDASQVKAEKSDLIASFESYIEKSVAGSDVSDIKCVSLFCQPKYSEDTEPDVLTGIVSYVKYAGEPAEQVQYQAFCIYPFDSRVAQDALTGSQDGITFDDNNYYTDLNELELNIKSGKLFYSDAEYDMNPVE